MKRFVRKIEACEAYHLHLATVLPDAMHVALSDYMPFEKLCSSGLSSLEVTDEIENGTRKWVSQLTGILHERPAVWQKPMAFRLTCTDGTQFLLGLSEKPFPVATVNYTLPEDATERSACKLSVTWTSTVPALIIV